MKKLGAKGRKPKSIMKDAERKLKKWKLQREMELRQSDANFMEHQRIARNAILSPPL